MMPIMDLRAYLNLNPFPIETFADGPDNNPKNIKTSSENHKRITGQVIVIQHVKNIIGLLVDRVVGCRRNSYFRFTIAIG